MKTNLHLQEYRHQKRYQNSQQQYKTDVKKKVTRQIQIIKPDATDEEVDEIDNIIDDVTDLLPSDIDCITALADVLVKGHSETHNIPTLGSSVSSGDETVSH